MSNMKSEKYVLSPEEIERRSLAGERFKTIFSMHRIEKTKKVHDRLDRYDKKRYAAKRNKLRESLMICENVLVLAERIKKKAAPGKFYKQSVRNISYFNKDRTFIIRKKQSIDKVKIISLQMLEIIKKLQKDSEELNYLILRAILLCDCIFHYDNSLL